MQIQKEIEEYRDKHPYLVKTRKARKIKRKYKITSIDSILVIKEKRQKIQQKAQRIQRYEKRTEFFRYNKILPDDTKKFYRKIGKDWFISYQPLYVT